MLPTPLPRFEKKPRKGLSIAIVFFAIIFLFVLGAMAFFAYTVKQFDVNVLADLLDTNDKLQNPQDRIKEINQIFDAENNLIHEYYADENRIYKALESISPWMQKAVIASEDVRFYQHNGFDLRAFLRATWKNIQTGTFSEGGSTLTQQLARNVYLGTSEKTIIRKIKEIYLARKIEETYSKDEILEFYLNEVYFGNLAYGVEAAAKRYFGITAKDLDIAQSAILTGILTSPSTINPIEDIETAKLAQKTVLDKMVEAGYINDVQHDKAFKEPIVIKPYQIALKSGSSIGYFIDYVKEWIASNYDKPSIDKGGLDIHTTLNQTYQQYADDAVNSVLGAATKNGEFGKVQADKFGTIQPQAALTAIDVDTGKIQAMVGGRDYKNTQYNRCLALRQPGSSFKIIDYSAALDRNVLYPGSLITSSPIDIGGWKPNEWFSGYFGTITVRFALAQSSNICAIRAALKTGLGNVVQCAKRMGIDSPLLAVPSLAIGYVEVKPLEMAAVMQTVSNYGLHIKPYAVAKVYNRKTSSVSYLHDTDQLQKPKRAISEDDAFDMISMLKGVVVNGTGKAARVPGVPCAGKTGTTGSFRDGWFVGATPMISASVYVGSDSKEVDLSFVKNYGSKYSAVIWKEFISKVSKGVDIGDWKDPSPGVTKVYVKLCNESGLLVNSTCQDTYWVNVRITERPTENCDIKHPKKIEMKLCKESKKVSNEWCKDTFTEKFDEGKEPKEKCDLHKQPEGETQPDENESSNGTKPKDDKKPPDKKDNQKPPDKKPPVTKPPDNKPPDKKDPEPKPEPEPEPPSETEEPRYFRVVSNVSTAAIGEIVRFNFIFNYENISWVSMYADGIQVNTSYNSPWQIYWTPREAKIYNLLFYIYDGNSRQVGQYSRTFRVTQ